MVEVFSAAYFFSRSLVCGSPPLWYRGRAPQQSIRDNIRSSCCAPPPPSLLSVLWCLPQRSEAAGQSGHLPACCKACLLVGEGDAGNAAGCWMFGKAPSIAPARSAVDLASSFPTAWRSCLHTAPAGTRWQLAGRSFSRTCGHLCCSLPSPLLASSSFFFILFCQFCLQLLASSHLLFINIRHPPHQLSLFSVRRFYLLLCILFLVHHHPSPSPPQLSSL